MWPNDILERLQQVNDEEGASTASGAASKASPPKLQVQLVSDDARTPLNSYTKEALRLRGGQCRPFRPCSYGRRPTKLRERNKTRYPSSRWNTPCSGANDRGKGSAGSLSSLHSVGRPPRRRSMDDDASSACSFDPPLKMPVRRGDASPQSPPQSSMTSSITPSCLSLQMPVRQDSFVLRPVVALASVRLPPASSLSGVAPPSSNSLPRRHHHHHCHQLSGGSGCTSSSCAVEGKSTVDMISQVLADLDLIDADEEEYYGGDHTRGGVGDGRDCWTV